MVERVFLTEARRKVLNDDYDGKESSRATQRSRIKRRADLALNELIEVAESSEIDNSDVFDPADVHRLLVALTTPPMGAGPVDPINPEDSLDNNWQAYRDRLYVQLSKVQQFQRETDR